MIPNKIKILFEYAENSIEVEVIGKSRYPNDYKLNDSHWKYFQFDCHDRPEHFEKPIGKVFRGYLIGKNKKYEEVYIKILE